MLAAVAAVTSTGIAGCARNRARSGVGNSFATDVIAHNGGSSPQTASITITSADSETPQTSRTLELAPGEIVDSVNSSKLPATAESYTIEVSVADGPSETFEWTDPTAELAPLWVFIDDTRNIKFLLQAG